VPLSRQARKQITCLFKFYYSSIVPCAGEGERCESINRSCTLSQSTLSFLREAGNLHAKIPRLREAGAGGPFATYVPGCLLASASASEVPVGAVVSPTPPHLVCVVCCLCCADVPLPYPTAPLTWLCTLCLAIAARLQPPASHLALLPLPRKVHACISITSKQSSQQHICKLTSHALPFPPPAPPPHSNKPSPCVPSFPCWSLPCLAPSAWRVMRVGSAPPRVMRTMPAVRVCLGIWRGVVVLT